jgi:hypothetical protein
MGDVTTALPQPLLKGRPAATNSHCSGLNRGFVCGRGNDARTQFSLFSGREPGANCAGLGGHFRRRRRNVPIRTFAVLHGAIMPRRLVTFFVLF